jgi:hypothetical protein
VAWFGFRRKGGRARADPPTGERAPGPDGLPSLPGPADPARAADRADGSAARSGTAGSGETPGGGPAAADGLQEIIRPAAIVPEHAARRVLVELAHRDLTNGGHWQSEPQVWSRYDGPLGPDGSREPELMGTIHVTYGTPTKYEITLYRVTVTPAGVAGGFTVASLTDEALGFGGLTLAECPRATVNPPPRPYTY